MWLDGLLWLINLSWTKYQPNSSPEHRVIKFRFFFTDFLIINRAMDGSGERKNMPGILS